MSSNVVPQGAWQSAHLPTNFAGGKNKPMYPQYSPFEWTQGGQKRWDKKLATSHFQRGVLTSGCVMSSPAPKGNISYDSHNAVNSRVFNPSNLSKAASRVKKETNEATRVARLPGRGQRQPGPTPPAYYV